MLADLGAQVTKVERPQRPDPWKRTCPQLYQDLTCRKEVQQVNYTGVGGSDAKSGAPLPGQAALYRTLAEATVLVTNLPLAALEAWGLEPKRLREMFPHLIIVLITTWGCDVWARERELSSRKGGQESHAFWEASGLGQTFGVRSEPPGLGELSLAQLALGGLGAALLRQQRTGNGQLVQVSRHRAGVYCQRLSALEPPEPLSSPLLQTLDGRFLRLLGRGHQPHDAWVLLHAVGRRENLADQLGGGIEKLRQKLEGYSWEEIQKHQDELLACAREWTFEDLSKAFQDKGITWFVEEMRPTDAEALHRRAMLAGREEIPVIGDSRVLIAANLLEEIPSRLHALGLKPAALAVVSDKTVDGLYGERLAAAFQKHGAENPGGPRVLRYAFAPGESSKNRETKAAIEDFMLANKCTRDSAMLALGGGVVGDLVGFTAATYMRGVPVVQVPTSTMAMIDSSVGGKTALNVPAGKNLIGAFHQPKVIFADPTVLQSLSRREVAEGLAEAIKMGIIRDTELFKTMVANPEKIMALDQKLMQEVLHKAVAHKADIVAIDEKETGLRATLNYGHTIGHAIEALVSPKLLHGECVAIGCVAEAELACRMGHLKAEAIPEIRSCFQAYGLPVVPPAGLTLEKVMEKMAVDKKNQGKTIRCTIITSVGTSIEHPLPVQRELMEAVVGDMLKTQRAEQLEALRQKQQDAAEKALEMGQRSSEFQQQLQEAKASAQAELHDRLVDQNEQQKKMELLREQFNTGVPPVIGVTIDAGEGLVSPLRGNRICPYCVIEIEHKPYSRLETAALEGTSPAWDYTGILPSFVFGDIVKFAVYHKEPLDVLCCSFHLSRRAAE
ncbi:unnamed protein product [Effrenium voratum]|nr:unnamed protein product [Effrenium voratum]